MGRSGDRIYESDAALDYQSTITDLLERELAYWLFPEPIDNSGWWLAKVFAVIELMLLLEQNNPQSSVYITEETVHRLRETVLNIWDGDWHIEQEKAYKAYPYDDPEYRKQHRPAITQIFDHLESLARLWESASNTERPPVIPLLADYPLPYFSVRHWTNDENKKFVEVDRFTSDVIEHLAKDIIYWLSPEKRAEVMAFNAEEVWVAVDLLGMMCEVYQQPPGINQPIVQVWRETATQIWRSFLADETSSLYPDVVRAFDRLEAVSLKYPSIEW